MGWWRFVRSAIEALTPPPEDASACDRAVRDLARESRLGALAHRTSRLVRTTWGSSRARAMTIAIARDLTPHPPAAAIRVRGWIAVATAVTVLGLDTLKPVPAGPLTWLVPSLAIAAGLLTMLMASPLARAAADRHARQDGSGAASR
jgi:hypothetical protein